jgi:hypothetical protein
VAFIGPEAGQEPRLVPVVGASDCAAEEHNATMPFTRPEDSPRAPRKRRPVKRDEHKPVVGACDEQCGIVQAKPRSVLPSRNV